MEKLFRIRCSQIGKIMGNGKGDFGLTQTATTYLKEWYSNDNEQVYSKYMEKGIAVESDLIDFMAEQLGYGLAEKNKIRLSDEYFDGECDVDLPDCVVDVKASWSKKTLHDTAIEGINKDYDYQLKGYCHLYQKPKGILFHGLMNTPETNFREEIIYEDLPVNERWIAYEVKADPAFIEEVKKKVIDCRMWLHKYEIELKSKLGKIN